MSARLSYLIACSLLIALGGCAFDVIHIEQYPERLASTQANCGAFELQADVDLAIGHGYQRVLKRGTRWHCVGRVSQGDVYSTRDQVLTLEASNVQEAYIVVESGKLVGFYMPVEKTFSPYLGRTVLPVTVNP